MMRTGPCQCEHKEHFRCGSHTYGQVVSCVSPVKTVCGTFEVCSHCRDNHLKEYILPKEPKKV
jgi:hypothetical protein